MKKLVALLLTLALVLCVGAAMAKVIVPTTVDEIKAGANFSAKPKYEIVKTDSDNPDEYQVVITSDWYKDSKDTEKWMRINGRLFEYNAADGTYSGIMPKDWKIVNIEFEAESPTSAERIKINADSNEVFEQYIFIDGKDITYEDWGGSAMWTWAASESANKNVSVTYNEKGRLTDSQCTLFDENVVTYVNFNGYGSYMNARAEVTDAETGVTYYFDWNKFEKKWEGEDAKLASTLKPLDLPAIQAPIAMKYEVKVLPENLSDVNLGVDISKLKPIPLGKVTQDKNGITIADMKYQYVSVEYSLVNSKGEEEYGSSDLIFDETSKNWKTDGVFEIPQGATVRYFLNNADGYSMYVDGEHEASGFNAYDGLYVIDNGCIVIPNFYFEDSNFGATYGPDGKMIAYSFKDIAGNSVEYTMDGTLLSYGGEGADGRWYTYSNERGWSYYDSDKGEYVYSDKKPDCVDLPDPLLLLQEIKKPEPIWYPNNTVGVVGFSLRDMYPELTSKWYNVVPVDLTQDGVQTFRLVASNLFYIGQAWVIVDGDDITVEYALIPGGHGYLKGETLTWFKSIKDISHDFLEDPVGDIAFGQAISRANDLDGQDVALLFICNRVTYRQPYFNNGGELIRYWPNHHDWIDYRNALKPLLDKVSE